jgi:hypothetical protein
MEFPEYPGTKAYTPEGRAEIVSREREVLQHINHQNRDLYNHCLRSLTSFQKDEVTAEYSEVYELPPGHVGLMNLSENMARPFLTWTV